MRSGKKSYCTAFDLYVGQYSKQHLTISSNVSWKFCNKKFDNPLTIHRMILKKSKWKHFYNYLDNTGLMFSTKTFYKLLSEDATKIGITIILFSFSMKDHCYTFKLKCCSISIENCAPAVQKYFAYLVAFTSFDLALQADSWSSDLTIKHPLNIQSIEQTVRGRQTEKDSIRLKDIIEYSDFQAACLCLPIFRI